MIAMYFHVLAAEYRNTMITIYFHPSTAEYPYILIWRYLVYIDELK